MSENKRVTISFLQKVLEPIVALINKKANHEDLPIIDTTLSVEGAVADAKAVRDELAKKQPIGDYALKSDIKAVDTITIDEIDDICGASIVSANEVKF